MSGETVHRTLAADPKYDDEFRASVRKWLLARLRAPVSDPGALPPEADNFRELRPLAHLDEAADEARRVGRRILAFVYDPSQKERGRLQHGLSYFLQNQRTRDTIASAFVVALIPISQVRAISDVLNNRSMEESRWVIFDADRNALEQAVIYANPQEGERIALDLADRFSA
jgi:serine/threonine-protein kinase